MYDDLSSKQLEILLYMKREISRKGYPPTVREICVGVGLKSPSSVHAHLNTLEAKGYIRKDATKPRAIEITDFDNEVIMPKKKTVDVPIVGRVTAGVPILAVENIEDTYPIPQEDIEGHDVFMLKIQGDRKSVV